MTKLQPYESYKEVDLPWIDRIPEHWDIMKTKYLFRFVQRTANYKNPKVLSLTQRGIVERDLSESYGQIAEDYSNHNYIVPGDIVLNPMDLLSGAAAVSKLEGVISRAYFTLSAITSNTINTVVYSHYFNLHYKLRIFYPYGKGVGRPEGSGGRWNINRETLMNFSIVSIPYPEQTQIAAYLDEKIQQIDKYIQLKKQQIELLEEQKTAIINQAVTKGLDPSVPLKDSGVEWLGEIPEHWRMARLSSLGTFQNGLNADSTFFESGTPFLSYSDVYRERSFYKTSGALANSNLNQQEQYSVKKGDVFFTRTSETIDEIGMSSVCTHTIPQCTFSGFLIRFRPIKSELIISYSKHYFNSFFVRESLVSLMNIVTRVSLPQSILKSLFVILPSLQEQKVIANYLDQQTSKIDTLISQTKEKIKTMEEFRTSLISSVVTGELDVREVTLN